MAGVSLNELTTYRWTFEQDVRHFALAGAGAMSVWRHKLDEFGADRGRELLADHGLAVACLMWAGGFTGSDGRSYRESVDDALEAIECAGDLHAGCLLIASGTRAGHTQNHARRLLRNALATLLPAAEQAGVTLALEPMHPASAVQWTFLTDMEEAVQWCRDVDSPYLKVALDTYHFGQQANLLGRIAEISQFLGIVHLGDARQLPDAERDRCPLGDGVVPLKAWIDGLIEAGYDGYFDVKLMGQEIETLDYDQLLRDSLRLVNRWVHAPV